MYNVTNNVDAYNAPQPIQYNAPPPVQQPVKSNQVVPINENGAPETQAGSYEMVYILTHLFALTHSNLLTFLLIHRFRLQDNI